MDLLNCFKYGFIICYLLCFSHGNSQTATDILNRSIQYHDPKGVWSQFKGQFDITMETPGSSSRHSLVLIDKIEDKFELKVKQDGVQIHRMLYADTCSILLNGSATFSQEAEEKHKLSCERTKMYRDYYSYLYGMPMKIKDEGAHLDTVVRKVEFHGREYLKLKVTYDESVGSDVWYFYFDPETYALQAYQFYHNEKANDGEYILLSDELKFGAMKFPKTRKWYMNTGDKYLGVDKLNAVKSL